MFDGFTEGNETMNGAAVGIFSSVNLVEEGVGASDDNLVKGNEERLPEGNMVGFFDGVIAGELQNSVDKFELGSLDGSVLNDDSTTGISVGGTVPSKIPTDGTSVSSRNKDRTAANELLDEGEVERAGMRNEGDRLGSVGAGAYDKVTCCREDVWGLGSAESLSCASNVVRDGSFPGLQISVDSWVLPEEPRLASEGFGLSDCSTTRKVLGSEDGLYKLFMGCV